MVLAPLFWNAAKGLNGGDFGSSQSPLVDDDLYEDIEDDEDILVYSGEEYEAVVSQRGLVRTGSEEYDFFLSDHEYRDLLEIATKEFGSHEEIIGLETEDGGETDQHIYSGKAENYSGKIDNYTNREFRFNEIEDMLKEDQFDDILEADQGPSIGYESSSQRAAI